MFLVPLLLVHGLHVTSRRGAVVASIVLAAILAWRLLGISVTIDRTAGTILVRNCWRSVTVSILDLDGVTFESITVSKSRYSVVREPMLMLDLKDDGATARDAIAVHAALFNDATSPLLRELKAICLDRMILYRVDAEGVADQ